ncbi:MAG TPA: GNAT family N-acetyltransferase [Candidatus Dormibacteraeota bacterium]|jgi:beta-N-acetylhexosaminidase|nr:GNAT family N-acetyltransferase [Candidatus Dormibacteraeota bacterium]
MEVRIRPLDPERDGADLARLWRAALEPWPLLPGGLALLRTGLVAEVGGRSVAALGYDGAGSIQLLLVDPAVRRRGVGTRLVGEASERLRALGAAEVSLGSGGSDYVWPGIPTNLPGAGPFFAGQGWEIAEELVADLICDLRRYTRPASAPPAPSTATLEVARGSAVQEAIDFEDRCFPEWAHYFRGDRGSILIARDQQGAIVGSLLFDGPGAGSVFEPMLGADMATIGCVGVAESARRSGVRSEMVVRASEMLRDAHAGNCHIGWAWDPPFYERLGYTRWREYREARRRLEPVPAS